MGKEEVLANCSRLNDENPSAFESFASGFDGCFPPQIEYLISSGEKSLLPAIFKAASQLGDERLRKSCAIRWASTLSSRASADWFAWDIVDKDMLNAIFKNDDVEAFQILPKEFLVFMIPTRERSLPNGTLELWKSGARKCFEFHIEKVDLSPMNTKNGKKLDQFLSAVSGWIDRPLLKKAEDAGLILSNVKKSGLIAEALEDGNESLAISLSSELSFDFAFGVQKSAHLPNMDHRHPFYTALEKKRLCFLVMALERCQTEGVNWRKHFDCGVKGRESFLNVAEGRLLLNKEYGLERRPRATV